MPYQTLSQVEIMERLKGHGIQTTAQTLRDWERQYIILPPFRGNKLRGRKAEYSEFVLAECFATNHLIRGDLSPADGVFIPRFTLGLLGSTVRELRQSGKYRIPNYPPPPREGDFASLPPLKQADEPKTRPLELPKGVISNPVFAYTLALHIRETSKVAWLWAVWIGCEVLLSQYRE